MPSPERDRPGGMVDTSTPLSEDELARMRARAEASSPALMEIDPAHSTNWQDEFTIAVRADDIDFLRSARGDILRLVAEIERLKKR